MAIDWSLGRSPDIIGNALAAYDEGKKTRREDTARRAAGTIIAGDIHGYGGGTFDTSGRPVTPPDRQQGAWNDLAMSDPATALQLRGQMQSQQQAQQTQRRADLPLITRLLDHAKDETTYQQAKAAAQQYGIDVSQLPQNFDPAWVEQQRMTLHALSDPVKMEALSAAGKQAADMGYKPGTPEFNKAVQDIWTAGESKPYVVGGETRLYQPHIGGQGHAVGAPQPGTIEEGYRFKGGNPADPNAWEPVGQGGPASAPGGFHVPSGNPLDPRP